MNQVNNANEFKESNSNVLDLESLTKEYSNLLISYKQAVTDYVNYLKQESNQIDSSNSNTNNSNNNQQNMVTINGSTYWGTSSVGENNSTTVQQCQASCAKTTGCTGATFNKSNTTSGTTCWLRGGDGNLSTGTTNDTAIVQTGKQLLSMIKNINSQLKTTNKKIQDKIALMKPGYNQQLTDSKQNTQELIKQFNMLSEDRNKVQKMLEEYETLDQQQEGGNIRINQNYYSFLLLIGITIIIIIMIISLSYSPPQIKTNFQTNFQTGGGVKSSTYYFAFFLFLVIYITVRFTYLKCRYNNLF
jgi:hypothetical protein